ncbi:MAG: F0F1 ATP synthase subunit delta [Candidatus Saccharimonadales bacterium]
MSSKRHHLAQIIGQRSLKAGNVDKFAQQIAAYLLDSGQVANLDSLMRDVMAYRAEHGVVEVEATSASRLSAEDIADIKAILKQEYPQAKTIDVDQARESEVMGGVKLDMPGEQLDLTVRAQVNKFKRLTTAGKGA